jgi:thiamine kinase-like enzyme
MEETVYTKNEIKAILETCLSNENVTDICVDIIGNSEKGDGYMGDIIFVRVTGKTKDGSVKEYNLVVKGSKKNKILRDTSAMKEFFRNEIHFYSTLLPTYTKFQLEKGAEETFNCVPKCYGFVKTDNQEVLVFENLSKSRYYIWDKKIPLSRNHIDLVVGEYAKFHAISAAMKHQQTRKFDELTKPLRHLYKELGERGAKVMEAFESAIEEIYDLLKDDLDEDVVLKWRSLRERFQSILFGLMTDFNGFEVVTHGDCWNNNFMFQSVTDDSNVPSRVRILDWQISNVGSPVFDLSHFLFACITEKDLNDIDLILEQYHNDFSTHLRRLGSDPDALYPLAQFLAEWNKYSRVGILFTSLIMKMCTVDKDDLSEMSEIVKQGHFANVFQFDVRNKTNLKGRMRPIVKYVVENGLID